METMTETLPKKSVWSKTKVFYLVCIAVILGVLYSKIPTYLELPEDSTKISLDAYSKQAGDRLDLEKVTEEEIDAKFSGVYSEVGEVKRLFTLFVKEGRAASTVGILDPECSVPFRVYNAAKVRSYGDYVYVMDVTMKDLSGKIIDWRFVYIPATGEESPKVVRYLMEDSKVYWDSVYDIRPATLVFNKKSRKELATSPNC